MRTLSWAWVTWPTLAELGVPEPFATPAAFCSSTDAGGVFRMNVKLRSCTGKKQLFLEDRHELRPRPCLETAVA